MIKGFHVLEWGIAWLLCMPKICTGVGITEYKKAAPEGSSGLPYPKACPAGIWVHAEEHQSMANDVHNTALSFLVLKNFDRQAGHGSSCNQFPEGSTRLMPCLSFIQAQPWHVQPTSCRRPPAQTSQASQQLRTSCPATPPTLDSP